MKIWKFGLNNEETQLVKMPSKSEIMDIQIQNGLFVMWALVDPDSEVIEVMIKIYGTGWEIDDNITKNEYLATVQGGSFVWHFFMSYEV